MTRATVTVDGVQLTREQVERAMRELDKPVEPTALERVQALKSGDWIRLISTQQVGLGDRYGHPNFFTYVVSDPIEGARCYVNIYSGFEWAITDKDLADKVAVGRVVLLGRVDPS